MKKTLLILLLLICGILTACTPKEENKKKLVSLAENGIEKIKPPKGCEIITNPDEFTPVTENQSYNIETDDTGFGTLFGLAGTETKRFYLDGHLHYYDTEKEQCSILCSKPDCSHLMEDSHTCSAYIGFAQGMAYSQNFLYSVSNEKIELIRVSLDGTEHTHMGKLCTVPEEDIINRAEGCYSITWIIHRGYIYYYYELYSGVTEDIYYLNGSNCLYRMPIDGSGEPECIIPFICQGISASVNLKAYGSYVYLNLPEKESDSGYLYRYNTESNKVEKLEVLGNDMRGYTIKDGNIYYSHFSEPAKIYCYDESTGDIQKCFDIFEQDEEHKCYPFMYSDEEHLYVPYGDGGITQGVFMLDWQGNMISQVPILYDDFSGTRDGRLYFLTTKIVEESPWVKNYNAYTIPYYLEKSDLKNGIYEIHEAGVK